MTTEQPATAPASQTAALDADRGAQWPVYVLAVLGPPLAMWVITHSIKRAATCSVASALTFGIAGFVMAVLAARRRTPRWRWAAAPLSERLVLVAGITAGILLVASYAGQ